MKITEQQRAELRELIYDRHPDGVHWLGDEPQNDIIGVFEEWLSKQPGTYEDVQEAHNEGWRLLKAVGDAYPPKAFLYRGGIYRYTLDREL